MKTGLGRGLDSLFGTFEEDNQQSSQPINIDEGEISNEIDIGLIDRNLNQPRKQFDDKALDELAVSIKNHGIIEPIIVKKVDNRYIIIAGERRWRAARLAGLKTIPCIVKSYSEQEISEIAIIENLQREDLNPIESARAIKNLIEQYEITQEEVAEKIGKSRSAITNTLRLLSLPESIISLIETNKLSAGHARALLAIEDENLQKQLAIKIIENNLSVREIENLIKKQPISPNPKQIVEKSLELKDFETKINKLFSTKVSIQGNDAKGKIIINYYSNSDLERIYDLLKTDN